MDLVYGDLQGCEGAQGGHSLVQPLQVRLWHAASGLYSLQANRQPRQLHAADWTPAANMQNAKMYILIPLLQMYANKSMMNNVWLASLLRAQHTSALI